MNIIEQLEALRIRYQRYLRLGIGLLLGGLILVLVYLLGWIRFVGLPGFLCVLAGFAVLIVDYVRYEQPFLRLYKRELVRSILSEQINDLRYLPDEGIAEEVVESTGMMQMGNTYHAGDFMEGSYHGVHFAQSDVCIQNIVHVNKQTYTETYLSGRWMIFDFNKHFRSDLQVCEKDFRYARSFGGLFSKGEKLHTLETESVIFNRAFTVAAENDSEAFYILTPHFMEKLLEVKAKISGDLLFCFIDSQLHVAIHDEYDSFEPNLNVPVDGEKIRRAVLGDLELITELIDLLRLDTRLFITE